MNYIKLYDRLISNIKSQTRNKAKNALNDYQKQNGSIYKHHNVRLNDFRWLKKDGKNKKIDKTTEQYQKLLDEGWKPGRNTFKRIPATQETKDKISKANLGKLPTTKGKILPTKGKTYEEIYGIEKAIIHKHQRAIASKGRINSKYIWKLTSPEGKEHMIENVNIINFFKPLIPSVTKTTIILLNQVSKTKKSIHHGILKGWKAIKVLKDVV